MSSDPFTDEQPEEELVDPTAPARDVNEIWLEHDTQEQGWFTVTELLIAIAVSAATLGVARLLRPGAAAAGVGLLLLGGIVYLSVGEAKSRLAVVTWWVLFVLYLTLATVAAWQGSPFGEPEQEAAQAAWR